jgi:hypothetical protein
VKGARQVDGDDGIPTFNWKVFNAGNVLDAGVVDQDIDSAKLFFGKPHHGFNFCGLAHVGAMIDNLGTQSGNFGFWASVVAKAIQNNVGTLFGQGFGDAQANATGGAGHESGFAFQHTDSPIEIDKT